jgi:hypothetical protein
MQDNKTLEGLRAVCLSIDHVDDLLLKFFTLSVAGGPAVPCSPAFFGDENVLRVV